MKNKDNELIKKIFGKFFLMVFAWTVGLPLLMVIINYVINHLDFNFVYEHLPEIYYLFRDLYYDCYHSDFFILFFFFIWLCGIIFIVYLTIVKIFNFLNSVSTAFQSILNNDVTYIELPSELKELQNKINNLKSNAIKNERLAKENEQRKNDLVVYLAHDLKTPLTSLIGYLSLLDEINDMPKKKREKYIKIALDKSYKLEDLINELFEITRFNSETIILDKVDINLNIMLEQIIDDFYPILMENDKEIKLDIKDKIILEGDSDKLARVFNNLIKNAIYYSTSKEINISVNKDDNNVIVIISNKGKMISKEKLDKIFDKFYRIDSARTSKTGGSGLGLAIAKEIIELHQGRIMATSDEDLTKFYVYLPLKK